MGRSNDTSAVVDSAGRVCWEAFQGCVLSMLVLCQYCRLDSLCRQSVSIPSYYFKGKEREVADSFRYDF